MKCLLRISVLRLKEKGATARKLEAYLIAMVEGLFRMNVHTYTQTIQAAYPELAITSVQINTTDGQFNIIVVVNGNLIFRFPRSEHVASEYTIHDTMLRFLAPQLPLPIPVPHYRSTVNTPWQQYFV